MRAYSQATYFVPTHKFLPCIDESLLKMSQAQTGGLPWLYNRFVDAYAKLFPGSRAPRHDGVINLITTFAGVLSLTDIQSMLLGKATRLPGIKTEWEFRSVDDIRWYGFANKRSKRCAERHLRRMVAAAAMKPGRNRKKTMTDGRIRSLTSIRELTPLIFRICGTFAHYVRDCRHKAAQQIKARDEAEMQRQKEFSRNRYKTPPAIGGLLASVVGAATPLPRLGPAPPEKPPDPIDARKALLILETRRRLEAEGVL